jgi:hypothetical protein
VTGHGLRACKINRGIDNSIPGVNELIGDMKDFHSSYSETATTVAATLPLISALEK